jgi:phospholipid/cholesterol/gamma-HCH transport system permease protein
MAPQVTMTRPAPEELLLQLAGSWKLGETIPSSAQVAYEIGRQPSERVRFDTQEVVAWDSALVSFASRVVTIARAGNVRVDRDGLPAGVQRLLALVDATPVETKPPKPPPSWLARVGMRGIARRDTAGHAVTAIGELAGAFVKMLSGTAKFRGTDLWLQIQQCGVSALGIVGLVAGLVGLIIAFISAVQLQVFGATVYVASLVGIAMVRELGAVMAAIVVAGRTGAAFAAELGTMRVTQEIDALTTLGLSPMEFLVLPRVIAVTVMLPLLCVYADLAGVVGGAIVGVVVMGVNPRLYLDQTINAVSLTDLFGGILKAGTYGLLIGMAGCFTGLRAGRSAAEVGKAATSAVVAGIVLVIVACGLYAVVFYRLGI